MHLITQNLCRFSKQELSSRLKNSICLGNNFENFSEAKLNKIKLFGVAQVRELTEFKNLALFTSISLQICFGFERILLLSLNIWKNF